MKKLINFKDTGSVRKIQEYANSNFDGNFTKAVISLCEKSLCKKQVNDGDSHLQEDLLK